MADTIFKDKTLLITGGTGSFGHTVLKHFLTTDIGEIRIFSRDEKKQDDMRHELQANYPDYYNKVSHARCGLCICCCCSEAGSFLRVFPHGGRAHQH